VGGISHEEWEEKIVKLMASDDQGSKGIG